METGKDNSSIEVKRIGQNESSIVPSSQFSGSCLENFRTSSADTTAETLGGHKTTT